MAEHHTHGNDGKKMAEKEANAMAKHGLTERAEKGRALSGSISVRGGTIEGIVVSAKAPKTVTVERILTKYVPKYERYKKIKSRVKAHNPETISAKEGDRVLIGETRKLSKTKSFVVMEILERGKDA